MEDNENQQILLDELEKEIQRELKLPDAVGYEPPPISEKRLSLSCPKINRHLRICSSFSIKFSIPITRIRKNNSIFLSTQHILSAYARWVV